MKIQPNWMFGYGYPVSVYYGDLFLYFPGILRLIGFPATFSYYAFLFVCNAVTVLVAYWCFTRIAEDEVIGILGAFLYTVSPYRLTDLYVRNAVGETFAMTFLPLIVYGIYTVFSMRTDDKKYDRLWIPMVIGFSGIIQSHMLSCLMCGLFVLLACVFCVRKVFRVKTFLVLAKTVIYTALLNAWFLFPCISSMKDIEVMQAYRGEDRIQNRGTHLSQLFNLFYEGNGDSFPAASGTRGEMALGIGLTLGLGLLLYVFAMIYGRKGQEKVKGKLVFGLCLFSLFMTTIYFPWDYISSTIKLLSMSIANIQFAWRFLAISSVLAVTVTCIALHFFKQQGKDCKIAITIGFLLAAIGFQYMMDDRMNMMGAEYIYDTASVGRTDYNVKEYLRPNTDLNNLNPEQVTTGEYTKVISYLKENIKISMSVENTSDYSDYVEVPMLYYDWYRAENAESEKFVLSPGENNVIRVEIPAGYCGDIRIYFHEPLTWRLAELLSLITLMTMIIAGIARRKPWRKLRTENCSCPM